MILTSLGSLYFCEQIHIKIINMHFFFFKKDLTDALIENGMFKTSKSTESGHKSKPS